MAKPLQILCVLTGGPIHKISVNGTVYRFEDHPYCGPNLVDKNDDPLPVDKQPIPFLKAASLWAQQGRKIENGLCVWFHESTPILKHLGGRHYQVVGEKPGERGT